MSEERREVLSMLREGILTVEDAERLLDALAAGEKARSGSATASGEGTSGAGSPTFDLKVRIAEIVDTAVRTALGSTGPRKRSAARETVEVTDGRFGVPEGVTLVVRHPKKHPGGGSILLGRAEEDRCCIRAEGPYSVHREGGEVLVEWEYGDIELEVPDAVSELSAETWGGNVEVDGLSVPLRLKSMGGDLRLGGICRVVTALTPAGNVWLSVDALDPGSTSEVTTQAGDIFVDVGPEFTGVIKGSVLAGEVRMEEGLGRAFESSAHVGIRNVALEIGPEPRRAELTVRTLRGNLIVASRS